jgi:hypothetical protein
MKSKKTEKYSGINKLIFENSQIQLYSTFSPFNWNNFFSTVSVPSARGMDDFPLHIEKQGEKLYFKNAKAEVYVPSGRTIDISAYTSEVIGRMKLGKVKSDHCSSINIDNFPEKLGPVGSTIAGVAGDLGYIAATCVPVAVFGVPLVKFFGGNPVNAIDDFLFLSAGINVGLRGDNKRAFYTSLAVAASSILGPEAIDAVRNGLDSGLDKIGLFEDGGKTIAYSLFWGVGKRLRDYYHEQTNSC